MSTFAMSPESFSSAVMKRCTKAKLGRLTVLLSGGEIPNTQFGIRSKYHRGPLIFGFGNLGVAGIYYQIPYSQIDHEFFFVLGDPVC